ncbi:MAG: helitron helicase-like domain-containing protein, partial [Gammaproteobacteria bacterium]|nr:helitron helicase-like domain-containing protein [Gammaproteobacteria bacterium]
PGEEAKDRPDLCARIFKVKYDALMHDLTRKNILGKVKAHSATIEWQKRGLTHAHILLIMEEESKPRTTEAIDRVVCAEIPDEEKNPELFRIVSECMVHGPCGALNSNSVCMEGTGAGRHCSKDFPKPFKYNTIVREDAFPEYRRRSPEQGGRTLKKKIHGREVEVTNALIVPYNPFLSIRFDNEYKLQ